MCEGGERRETAREMPTFSSACRHLHPLPFLGRLSLSVKYAERTPPGDGEPSSMRERALHGRTEVHEGIHGGHGQGRGRGIGSLVVRKARCRVFVLFSRA